MIKHNTTMEDDFDDDGGAFGNAFYEENESDISKEEDDAIVKIITDLVESLYSVGLLDDDFKKKYDKIL